MSSIKEFLRGAVSVVFLISLLVAGALFLHLFEDGFGVDLTAPIGEYAKESIENVKKSAETGALAGALFIATFVGDIFAESLTMVSEWRWIPVFFLLMILLLTASVLGIAIGPVMVVIGVIALIASAVGYLAFETIEISFAKPLLSIAIGLAWSFNCYRHFCNIHYCDLSQPLMFVVQRHRCANGIVVGEAYLFLVSPPRR